MSVITIIGAGMMGSAMSFPARDNGNEVRLVGSPLDDEIIDRVSNDGFHPTLRRQLPDRLKYYKIGELDKALDGADYVICGVSSFGVKWFGDEILPLIPVDVPVLSVTKGMLGAEDGTLVTYLHYYAKQLEEQGTARDLNAVGGPCTSYELADRDQTYVCFCGDNTETLIRFKTLLETDYYHITVSNDVIGVECAVAMKNAYALAVSLAIGISEKIAGKERYNSQAALFAQSVREMRRLLALTGGGDDNIVYGAGDLYVTVFGGRTRKLGILLGRGLSINEAMEQLSGITLESVVIAERTALAVRRKIELKLTTAADFPLLLHVDAILKGAASAKDIPWQDFQP